MKPWDHRENLRNIARCRTLIAAKVLANELTRKSDRTYEQYLEKLTMERFDWQREAAQ